MAERETYKPPMDKKAWKRYRNGGSDDGVTRIPANDVLEAIKDRKNINIEYAVIDGDLNIDTIAVPIKDNKGRSIIEGWVAIKNAEFRGVANFSEVTFSDEVNFGGSTFSDKVSFMETTFIHKADFSEATFNGCASFREANFSGRTFSDRADFSKATFNNRAVADFWMATFNGQVVFRETKFYYKADFHEANFNGMTDFSKATFSSLAYFRNVKMKYPANFSDVHIKENTYKAFIVNEILRSLAWDFYSGDQLYKVDLGSVIK